MTAAAATVLAFDLVMPPWWGILLAVLLVILVVLVQLVQWTGDAIVRRVDHR